MMSTEVYWSASRPLNFDGVSWLARESPAWWVTYRFSRTSNGWAVQISDPDGHALTVSGRHAERPAGRIALSDQTSLRCLVGFLWLAHEMGLHISAGEEALEVNPYDPRSVVRALGNEKLHSMVEDLAMEIGLVPAAFRLRHLESLLGPTDALLDVVVYPTASSVIQAYAYDEKSLRLYVLFCSGRGYEYERVGREQFEGLKAAPSPGKYFNAQIRKRHEGREMAPDRIHALFGQTPAPRESVNRVSIMALLERLDGAQVPSELL